MEQKQWQWQEEGTSWRGVGIYHVTLTIPSRQPLLGSLNIPEGDPTKAVVERTELGRLLLECQRSVPVFHPEIQILQYCLMPDHLHVIWYVRQPMKQSIRQVAQGFWQAAKKVGRAYSYASYASLTGGAMNESGGATNESNTPGSMGGAMNESSGAMNESSNPESKGGATNESGGAMNESSNPGSKGGATNESNNATNESSNPGSMGGATNEKRGLSSIAAAGSRENPLCEALGNEAYWLLDPVFTERPFLRPLSRRGQLQAMLRYVRMNPQRLATKRLMPGFFRVQKGIEIGGRSYDGVGNVALLQAEHFDVVHVRSTMVRAAEHGDCQPLRDYMNSRVLEARQGVVMVSPFISPNEKRVMNVLLEEQRPFVLLADNGFRDYYKPTDALFDACAAGRVLILSPWPHDTEKRHISRADCVALNMMAEEMVRSLSSFPLPRH